MESITISADVRRDLALLAGAWAVTEGEAVRRLIRHFQATTGPRSAPDVEPETGVEIHAVYLGTRVDGVYFPSTRAVELTGGPLAGRTFASVSGAAKGVVSALNPKVKPNRDGWTFWTVTATGDTLASMRRP